MRFVKSKMLHVLKTNISRNKYLFFLCYKLQVIFYPVIKKIRIKHSVDIIDKSLYSSVE